MLIKLDNVRFSCSVFILTAATLLSWGISSPSQADTFSPSSPKTKKAITGAVLLKNIQPLTVTQNQQDNRPLLETETKFKSGIELPKSASFERKQINQANPASRTPEARVLVSEVLVEGANEELKELIYRTINVKPGRTTTRSQLQEDLNAIYATGFFQNVEVSPQDTPLGVRIAFTVEPNPKLSRVELKTTSPTAKPVLSDKKVSDIFGKNYGRILNLRELQQGIIKVNQWYAQNGYELAQVVGTPQISPQGNITLVITEGIIEDIKVRYFNEQDKSVAGKTREFIITREVQSEPGQVFQRHIAQGDLQRIYGLGIFQDARLSFAPGKDPNRVVINIDVVENSGREVKFEGGYSSDVGLLGTVGLKYNNVGGNNQTLGSEISLSDNDLLYNLSFTDPWIASSDRRDSYTVNASRRSSRSLVFNGKNDINTDNGNDTPRLVKTGGGIQFAHPISSNPFERQKWRLSSSLEYQRVAVKNGDDELAPLSEDPTPNNGSDDRSQLTISDDGTDDLFSLSLNATRDRLNNRLQPTKGSLLDLGTEQTLPIGSGNIAFNRVQASYSQYFPINLIGFSQQPEALAFNIQGGTILGDLPPYEAFVLGGGNSVRGFEEGEVGNGKSYFQATAEYRFPIFKIVRGAMFFDYGTNLGSGSEVPGKPASVRGLPGSGYGYGLGVRLNTPIAPIRIDYAINDDGETRIQFGLNEKF